MMTTKAHTQSIQQMLAKSDRQFAAGDAREGSATLWRAAECAMIAVAKQRGWAHGDNKALMKAANRLSEEMDDASFSHEFGVAEMFRENSEYGFFEDYEPDAFKSIVHEFVHRIYIIKRRLPA